MDRLWRSNSSISSRTSCLPDIVNEEDHNVEKRGASVFMCLPDAKSKNFKDTIFCMVNVSLNDDPVYFKPEAPSSVCPSDSDFPFIDNLDYVKQLRVLTVLNENFRVDLTPLYDEFMLSKNRIKRKYFQDNFAQSKKNRVESKWLEDESIEKTYFIF